MLVAQIGAWFMKQADKDSFEYHEQLSLQREELQELKALSAAYDIKDLAEHDGGWEDHHGIGLDMLAQVLVMQHGWEPEDVGQFVGELTEGFFDFAPSDEEDDEE